MDTKTDHHKHKELSHGQSVSGGGQNVLNKPSFEHFFLQRHLPPPPFSFQLPLPNLRVTLSILIKATIHAVPLI